eukprot:197374_1
MATYERAFLCLLFCIIGSMCKPMDDWFFLQNGVNGGNNCVVCTLLVSFVWQVSNYNNLTYEQGFDQFCQYLSTEPNKIIFDACEGIKDVLQKPIAALLNQGDNPDEACQALRMCTNNAGYYCSLYPTKAKTPTKANKPKLVVPQVSSFCNITGVEELCKLIETWSDDHLPPEDFDNDTFSLISQPRGWNWRGKDCNDLDSDIHPGRTAKHGDTNSDSNCNGIYGIDKQTGKSYEDIYCNNTDAMGMLLLGDSAGAHFHIPPEWMNVTQMSTQVFQQLYFVLLNELDWPHLSTTTAFYNSTDQWKHIIQGPVDSLYLRFLQLNRCNKNDYANMGVNGARSSSMSFHLDQQLRRSPLTDKPAYVNYELLGNDVCNGHPGFSHMTTPQEFYDNNMKVFQYLDANLPTGSQVVANGLANGSVLYEAMHDRIHPIGALYNDVTYTDLYDYLNCLQISPCWGWMNSNQTDRELTTQRAVELNDVLEQLVANTTFQNIEIIYIDWIQNITNTWKEMGGEVWQLIEPVDGFHPNQLSNALTTALTWNWTLELFPGWLPSPNPYNEELIKIFGP